MPDNDVVDVDVDEEEGCIDKGVREEHEYLSFGEQLMSGSKGRRH